MDAGLCFEFIYFFIQNIFHPRLIYFKKKKKKVNELFKWYLKKIRSLIAERERVIGHEGTRRGVTV